MANNFSLNLCFKRINYHNFKLGLLINVRNISNDSSLAKKTCLHDYHVQKGGKMVNFAGFIMPVSYNDQSIIDSHLHTRKLASLFDVSHMLQMMVKGKDCVDFIESITVADIATLKPNSGTLTLYTNDNGGIIDDLIVTKISQDSLFVVSNAGRIDQDLAHVNSRCQEFKSKRKDVSIEVIQNRALLALQGPSSAEYLQSLVKVDLSKLYFMTTISTSMSNIEDCRVTRCGYTGEDGFEISIPKDKAEFFADKLLSNPNVKLAGLGARDTLRLEAGLCLYGNDIDESTTPIEAGLAWTISKRRRELANFPGASIILNQLKKKPNKRRVGIVAFGSGAPARSHCIVLDVESKEKIGDVTSGSPSPSLNKNIAMCYVSTSHSKVGTKLLCDVRGKQIEYQVVKMPFVPTTYYVENK